MTIPDPRIQEEIREFESNIRSNNLDYVKNFLLNHNISEVESSYFSSHGESLLSIACSSGATDVIQAVINGEIDSNLYCFDESRINALGNFCSNISKCNGEDLSIRIIKGLIMCGFDPNTKLVFNSNAKPLSGNHKRYKEEESPMSLLCYEDCGVKTFRTMLEVGADPNTHVLFDLIGEAHEPQKILELLKIFLEFGFDINLVNCDGDTILNKIIDVFESFVTNPFLSGDNEKKTCNEIVLLLLGVDVDLNKKNKDGKTSVMIAEAKLPGTDFLKCIKGLQYSKQLAEVASEMNCTEIASYISKLPDLRNEALKEKERFQEDKKKFLEGRQNKLKAIKTCKTDTVEQDRSVSNQFSKILQSNKGASVEKFQKVNDGSDIKMKRCKNACKFTAVALSILATAMFISSVCLFVIKYEPVRVPVILICFSVALVPPVMLFYGIVSGCFVTGIDKQNTVPSDQLEDCSINTESLPMLPDILVR